MSTNDETTTEDETLGERIRRNPGPATMWVAGAALLVAVQFGAIWSTIMGIPWETVVGYLPAAPGAAALAAVGDALADLPTLLDRSVIPNQGYYHPDDGWRGTFLGLSPAVAWALRVALVYAYAFTWVAWVWKGYNIYREIYRTADWTPRDDMVDRLRSHHWGQFGFIIVFMFIVLALFAPTLGPTTITENIQEPYSHEIEYFDSEAGEPATILVGYANQDTTSGGSGNNNVGVGEYDQYDRYHPFGTITNGKDLFTFLAGGARISLFIGLVSMGLAGVIALSFAMISAYYKGLTDIAMVLASDSIMALPGLPLLILLTVVLGSHPIAGVYNGALLLALIFAFTRWPGLWRSLRGPAFQISEEEWIDAARSYGQRPRTTMRKHMAPYVLGYLLIYTSMSLGGVIIATSGLSFLGLGITAPTPEWGRAIDMGQDYITTQSWHISLIPGFLIVLVVTAFNALGDGIRDAIDPQSDLGSEGESGESAAAASGGGA
ncbi:ABC transporter permease [Halomontanus rarus]|uniref:ABC transporter permease n=1 Tax=Halomontanus rarus TaxID=3034020 RepID=UPI0023E7ECD1|nr:ABC transporter permease [Halovivax sp. TS33]